SRWIAILLATALVAADGLQMAVGAGTDPHLGPGRRDDDRADARDLVRIAQALSVGIDVDESASRAPAADPRQRVADVAQPGGLSRREVGASRRRFATDAGAPCSEGGFAHSARSKRL